MSASTLAVCLVCALFLTIRPPCGAEAACAGSNAEAVSPRPNPEPASLLENAEGSSQILSTEAAVGPISGGTHSTSSNQSHLLSNNIPHSAGLGAFGSSPFSYDPFQAQGGGRPFDIGRPFQLDSKLVYCAAQWNQSVYAAAFDGENYFVVWTDGRGGQSDIYGARVDATGTVLDPTGIIISTAEGDKYHPDVAFDGRNFLIVWTDRRGNSSNDIYGARVDCSGSLLDPEGFPICTEWRIQESPAVAFDGRNCMVVWKDFRHGYPSDLYGARVSPSGTVLDRDGIAISTAENHEELPDIAFDGANYLVVWEEGLGTAWNKHIHGARVRPSGAVIDPDAIVISSAGNWETKPVIAFNGENYMVVWRKGTLGSPGQSILGARVSPSGTVLDPEGISLSVTAEDVDNPAIASDGTNWVVLWQEDRETYSDIHGRRVSASGDVIDPDCIPICTLDEYQLSPAVAFGTTAYLVLWNDQRNVYNDVYGARVDTSGTVLDYNGRPVSTSANLQRLPAAAFDGNRYLVVWEDEMSGRSEIRGTRVDPSGTVQHPISSRISGGVGHRRDPAVAFDGENYMVVWEDRRDRAPAIYGTRIDDWGTVLDPDGIPISLNAMSETAPAITFNGTDYIVVWQEYYDGDLGVLAARIDKSGTLLDPKRIPIAVGVGDQSEPAIASDGRNCLAVWTNRPRADPNLDIYGARLDPSGKVIGAVIPICSTEDLQQDPGLAFDGLRYMVVWEDRRGTRSDIYGARVHPAGIVIDKNGIRISNAHSWESRPAIAFADSQYVVVWQDSGRDPSDIYGARVDPTSGTVLDSESIPVSAGPHAQHSPAVTPGPSGQVLATYSSFVPPGTFGSSRIFANFLSIQSDRLPLKVTATPNPFRTDVSIGFRLPAGATVRLTVHDAAGRLVRTVARGYRGPGWHQEVWDGTDEGGRSVTSGIYFMRVLSKFGRARAKCVLVR